MEALEASRSGGAGDPARKLGAELLLFGMGALGMMALRRRMKR